MDHFAHFEFEQLFKEEANKKFQETSRSKVC